MIDTLSKQNAARDEFFTALCTVLGEPDRRNSSAPYLSVFWSKYHISATIWKEGRASIHVSGTFQEMLEAVRLLKTVPASGFMQPVEE